ncbi:MAG: hypothetical protein ACI8Y4_002595, partial [Candidatus Poriferisodalaceae bacterium]
MGSGTPGLVTESNGALDATEEALRRTGSEDGLPDLLFGLALLADALGELPRATRWVTAIRLSETPTQNLPVTTICRQLRARVGLTSETEGLEDTAAIYVEARQWIRELL